MEIHKTQISKKIFHSEWNSEISRSLTKTHVITASNFLLEYDRVFRIPYIHEHPGLISQKNQLLKNNDNISQSMLMIVFPLMILVYVYHGLC